MEVSSDNTPPDQFWSGKRVFVTGHTGFKGGWLCSMLVRYGAIVKGYALEPLTQPSIYYAASISADVESHIADVRDLELLKKSLAKFHADVIIHMAAQPLVRSSYRDPVATFSTNVIGTANILEAARECSTVGAIVVVTTDKCYENKNWLWGYRETDRLGGYDPYSSSKACAELVASAYRRSFFSESFGPQIATARAGNVIGGGDWSLDRLLPDLIRSLSSGVPLQLRNPGATRPWQHVLEPLSGYLMLAKKLFCEGDSLSSAYNFGPRADDSKTVQWVVEYISQTLGYEVSWTSVPVDDHEAASLQLDSSKAFGELGWQPRWSVEIALKSVMEWHAHFDATGAVREIIEEQIKIYSSP